MKDMNCPYCHKPIHPGETYCSYCGKRLDGKKEKKEKPWLKQLLKAAVLIAILMAVTLYVREGRVTYPKGMYVLYDESGKTIASLSLRTDGSYVLNDLQNYSSYESDQEEPVVVFHHDFQVGKNGLKWDQEEKGKLRKEEGNTYVLEDFLGGLFDETEDACLFCSEDQIFLYPYGDDSQVFVLEKPQ